MAFVKFCVGDCSSVWLGGQGRQKGPGPFYCVSTMGLPSLHRNGFMGSDDNKLIQWSGRYVKHPTLSEDCYHPHFV